MGAKREWLELADRAVSNSTAKRAGCQALEDWRLLERLLRLIVGSCS